MTLQNRVDPFANIHAVPDRGTCMGNRGILHDDARHLHHYHQHKNWVICRLSFKDRKRIPMTPGRYTELFFLDEATALAAGHRPCAACSRLRYKEFVRRWQQANSDELGEVDDVLHHDRFVPYQTDWGLKKQTYTGSIDSLPVGSFITFTQDRELIPYLILEDTLRPWRFAGYGDAIPRPTGQTVTVLTPRATVRVLAAGYRPAIYPESY